MSAAAQHIAHYAEPAFTPTGSVFERIGAFLADHHLSPDPDNYAFAYAIVTEPAGPLAAAVARIADGGCRLKREDIVRLGGNPAAGVPLPPSSPAADAPPPVSSADDLIARAQIQVDGFVDEMQAMRAEAHGFGRDLAASAAAIDDARMLPAIEEIVRLTSAMRQRVHDSEVRLEAATREADVLRGALDEARGSARRDPLTELPNRRAFDEAFADIAEPMTLALCDIDHFKQINDRFGHAVGDRVLRAIGQALAGDCPDCLVARYGGEEFVVLVPGGFEAAVTLLDDARERVAGKRFRLRDTDALLGSITFSAGLAAVRPGETAADALGRADKALYAAKAAGRNCVHIAPKDGG